MPKPPSNRTDQVIGDLIDVPPVTTVVQLSDLERSTVRKELATSFVLTDEVFRHLRRFLSALEAGDGFAGFLRGHYGSGKSHFLAFVQLLLSGEADISRLTSSAPELTINLPAGRRFMVVSMSLVSHSAQEPLERIVSQAFGQQTGPAPLPFPSGDELTAHLETFRYHVERFHPDTLAVFLEETEVDADALFSSRHLPELDRLAQEIRFSFRPDPGRAVRFDHLFQTAGKLGLDGVVLLIDELSEFLHSKSGPALAEDVRFLQFLGELTSEAPLYLIAALQEFLEAAEYGLPGELVRKIKDRYPNNLELTTTHIEELVSRRLIHRKPGSDDSIREIYERLRSYLHGFPVPADRFVRAYPIHPATTLLLDRLKPLLSRSRGIVDFIHYRLRGSPERGIDGLMDAPADTLLTPDAIFDHFRTRIRENIEIAAFDTTVYDYYSRSLDTIFPDESSRILALRTIKLLILLAISPEPRPYSVKTITHALLVRISRVDPQANFLHLQDVLERLVALGAFVERVPSHGDGHLDFNDVYRISLQADMNLVLARRMRTAIESLRGAEDLRIFEALAPELKLESLPLHRLLGREDNAFSINWQRTSRQGCVLVRPLFEVSIPRVAATVEALKDDPDWALFIGTPYQVEAQTRHLRDVLLPALRRVGETRARTILFWLPKPIQFDGPDGDFLYETLARRAIIVRIREEAGTSQAKRLLALLEKGLDSDRSRIESIFHHAYYQGHVESVAGREEDISALGRPLFEQTLLAVLNPVFNARFPDHAACAPLGRMPSLDDVETITESFLRPGQYQPQAGRTDVLATRLVSLLRPLGLVKKTGSVLALVVDLERSAAVRELLSCVDETPRALSEVARHLRKGKYGMARTMFQLLVLGLAYSGTINCHTRGKRRDVHQLSALNFDQIDEVSRCPRIELDLSRLDGLPFLPEKLPLDKELTYPNLDRIWQGLTQGRSTLTRSVAAVRRGLSRVRTFRSLSHLEHEPLERDVARLEAVAEAVDLSAPPSEGLARFLDALPQPVEIANAFDRVALAARFFEERLDRYLLIHRYVDAVGGLPAALELAELEQQRAALRDALTEGDHVQNDRAFARVHDLFKCFQSEYLEKYLDAHARQRGPGRFRVLESMRGSAPYRVLERLAAISTLGAREPLRRFDRELEDALAKRCHRLQAEDLLASPRCACGLRLGDEVALPSPEMLQASLGKAIAQALEGLAGPSQQPGLERALEAFVAAGRTRDETKLERLRAIAASHGGAAGDNNRAGAPDWNELEKILTADFARALDQALLGVIRVENRSLDLLISRLRGRCLPRQEVERVLGQWLTGEAPAKDALRRSPPPEHPQQTYYRFELEADAPRGDD